MSTLWYRGSDGEYHYFAHLYMRSTRYRIRRADLDWKSEFPLGSQNSVFCSPVFQRYSTRKIEDKDADGKTLPATEEAEQDGAGQPATRPESKPEGSDKPQPTAEGRSR